jgi:trehalose/maltose hydrolase-like predicted phosphorylase
MSFTKPLENEDDMTSSALDIKQWLIETQSEDTRETGFYESIFSQSNGYMGVRGYAPESPKRNSYGRSVFLAGFFEYIKSGITDMVNQPDFSRSAIWLNGASIVELPKTFLTPFAINEGMITSSLLKAGIPKPRRTTSIHCFINCSLSSLW